MQFFLDMDGRTEALRMIHKRLRDHFVGFPPRYVILDPVSQLVMSMLGGHTYSHVSKAAHADLVRNYRNWSDVRAAPVRDIEYIIRNVTYAEVKASRLVRALALISDESGHPSLDHLAAMSVEAAHDWLERIPGVGPKTAAAVLNTSYLRKRSLVIDTHHLRILERLQIVRPNTSIAQAYSQVMPLLPSDWSAHIMDVHHMLFKKLGQVICRVHIAHCEDCPLNQLCPHTDKSDEGKATLAMITSH
jgi:endonuclease-3